MIALGEKSARPTPWIGFRQATSSARLRLLCCPYAGAGGQIYKPWSTALAGVVEVCGLQPPGRWSRSAEPPISSIETLAHQAADALLRDGWLDAPFAVYGHSFGAALALELCRELHRRGGPAPVHLYVGARVAPPQGAGTGFSASFTDEQLARWLKERYRAVPERVLDEPELAKLLLPLLRADLVATESYRPAPEPRLEVPLTVYGGADDDLVPLTRLAGWGEYAVGGADVQEARGGHFFPFDEGDSGPFLETLRRSLADDADAIRR